MLEACETLKNFCPIRNRLVSGAGAVSVTYAAAATAATRRGKWEGRGKAPVPHSAAPGRAGTECSSWRGLDYPLPRGYAPVHNQGWLNPYIYMYMLGSETKCEGISSWYFCCSEHPWGARGRALRCRNVAQFVCVFNISSASSASLVLATTEVARSQVPNSFHQKVLSNDKYFWWKPGTLLNPLNAGKRGLVRTGHACLPIFLSARWVLPFPSVFYIKTESPCTLFFWGNAHSCFCSCDFLGVRYVWLMRIASKTKSQLFLRKK